MDSEHNGVIEKWGKAGGEAWLEEADHWGCVLGAVSFPDLSAYSLSLLSVFY
jgi:hypothetical protein